MLSFSRKRGKIKAWERIFLSLFFLGILFFFSQVQAARIAITPLVFELTGERGQIVESEVRVMNPSYTDKITVKMEAEDMYPQGEEGQVRLEIPPEERIPFSLSSWISFEPKTFSLEPREEKPVKFRIKVPENAEPGGHYAGIIAKVETMAGPGGVGVGIVQRVASLVLLTVPGVAKEEIALLNFETSKLYYETGPVKFLVRLENRGNIHLRPQATISITNFLGQKVGEVQLEQRNILPGAIRKYEIEWPKKWLWWGKYKATLSGFYGQNKIPLGEREIEFWAFPWKIGVLLGLLIVFFIFTRRRWIKALKILIKGEKA